MKNTINSITTGTLTNLLQHGGNLKWKILQKVRMKSNKRKKKNGTFCLLHFNFLTVKLFD